MTHMGTHTLTPQDQQLVYNHFSGLAELPDHYQALFAENSSGNPFRTFEWYRCFEQLLIDHSQRLRIYVVDRVNGDDRMPLAMFPARFSHQNLRLRTPRTLQSLSNYYTSLFEPVFTHNESDITPIVRAIVEAMLTDRPRWETVDLQPLAREGPMFDALAAAFRERGLLVQPYFCFGNWYMRVDGRTYAQYFEALPSQTRNTVRRKSKQFAAKSNSNIRVYCDLNDVDEGLLAYERVYSTSWKTAEPYPEFIREICRTWARLGSLRLGVAYLEGVPAAAQIWIVQAGTASIFKLAYDERFAKQSIGSVLTAHLMEHVIDVDNVVEIDYLTGDDSYKKEWMSHRRERWGMLAIDPRSPRGLLAALRHVGGRKAKQALIALRGAVGRAAADRRRNGSIPTAN